MRLSQLEIKGFKSFGEKVILRFGDGITGIVGPNGCGKSNVIDAIRWVLGEQKSKALRSDKMENIIFNGTKKRKPLQMAEVSLTFDNTKNIIPTEYTQVTITRKYYKSGESEYLLNGIRCRLKDISNLFLDTGIGSNSYAIIELKMIDDILNNKENSRKILFEEAAGILKFKIRKKETLRKLTATDTDLERVEDLLFEIEKNMKSLEYQAKKTKKYYEYKASYKTVYLQLTKTSAENSYKKKLEVQKKIAEEENKKTELDKIKAQKEASLELQKKNHLEQEKLLSTQQKHYNTFVQETRQLEHEQKIKQEQTQFLKERQAQLEKFLEQDHNLTYQIIEDIQGLTKRLDQEKEEEKNQRKAKEKLHAELQKYQQKAGEQQHQLNQQQIILQAQKNESNTLNQNLEVAKAKKGALINSLKQLEEEHHKIHENINADSKNISTYLNQLQKLQKELEKIQSQEEEHQKLIRKHQQSIDELKSRLIQEKRSLDAKNNEYQLVKSHIESLEGFPEAIKYLKRNQEWNQGSLLLSDILTCEAQYKIGIENYLRPWMDYFVFNTKEDALQAIQLLKNKQKGKANFFILNYFDTLSKTNKQEIDGLVWAMDIIQYEKKFQALLSYLLQDVYLIEEDHISLASFEKNPINLITKDGSIIKRKFSLEGGSSNSMEGKTLGGLKNLENIQRILQEMTEQVQQKESALQEASTQLLKLQQENHVEKIRHLQKEIQETKEKQIALSSRQEHQKEFIENHKKQKEQLREDITQLQQEIEKKEPQLQKNKEELSALEQALMECKEKLENTKTKLSEVQSHYNEENIRHHQINNKIERTEQEINFKKSQTNDIDQRLKNNQQEAKQIQEQLRSIEKDQSETEKKRFGRYAEQEKLEKELQQTEKNFYQQRGETEQLEQDIKNIQKRREQQEEIIKAYENQNHSLLLELNTIKERLMMAFNLELDQVMDDDQLVDSDLSELELIAESERLKNKMDAIGNINPMAMEAYEEIKERYTFIHQQKEDLKKAKEDLLHTISEVDQVAKENFLNAFEQIRTHFKSVFQTLFSEEDTCDLVLLDEKDPLESDIEIMAQPKGKKPLSINQLSGGEKTLTATALLFSIYLLKPAPFCIFDEVDAPLDDANIDKFNRIIRKFSKDSQFIIVTHNKRTMASTDIMYGVMMNEKQDPGVSMLVPVDLREAQEAV